ncbi:MAG: phosphate transport system permease protein [Solirubrobacteraceae bacterium]|jgi:phosphate transport system permease protein|nr:phosphate transport system permease protein [Solirubrobacteraceae bacterium]
MSIAATPTMGFRLDRGALPRWAPWGVAGGFLAVAILLSAATSVSPALAIVFAAFLSTATIYGWSRAIEGKRRAVDRAVTYGVTYAFLLAVAPLVSLLITVINRGSARFDTTFFTHTERNVLGVGGGAYHAIMGTLIITGMAALFAIPIGILTAIYLVEYGRGRMAKALTFFIDVMTGIPSIVAGLFVLALFSVFFGPGVRLGIMGSIALMVLMIPIVVRSTEEVLRIVPNKLREAAYGLGVPKWRIITKVVLPTALAGIVSGVMLSISRVMGETAPLLVTTGVVDSFNGNPFNGRMQNLAVFAFNEYKSPGIPKQAFIDRAWAAALTLILIVMILNLLGRFIYRRFGTEIR